MKTSLNVIKLFIWPLLILTVLGGMIASYIGVQAQTTTPGGTGGWDPNYLGWPGNALNNFYPTVNVTLATVLMVIIGVRNFILFLGVVLGIIFLVLGGINYMRAGGDETKIATARAQIIGGIVGLAVAVAAFVLLNLVIDFVKRAGEGITELR